MFKKKKDITESITAPEFENSVTGVEPVLKKKKGKKVAIISGISAAVLVGGGIAAYNLSPLIKNQVKLRTMKPENYYAWVNTENAETFAKSIREKYEKMLDNYGNGTQTSMSLKYVPTDIAKDWAIDDLFYLDAEEDDLDRVLYDFINDLENVQLNVDVQKKNGNSLTSVSGLVNDEKLLSADVFMDSVNMDYFMRIPELTQRWLGYSIGDTMDGDAAEIFQIYQDILNNPASYLSPDELEEEIIKYTDLWNTCIEDVKLEKSEEVGGNALHEHGIERLFIAALAVGDIAVRRGDTGDVGAVLTLFVIIVRDVEVLVHIVERERELAGEIELARIGDKLADVQLRQNSGDLVNTEQIQRSNELVLALARIGSQLLEGILERLAVKGDVVDVRTGVDDGDTAARAGVAVCPGGRGADHRAGGSHVGIGIAGGDDIRLIAVLERDGSHAVKRFDRLDLAIGHVGGDRVRQERHVPDDIERLAAEHIL